MGQPALIETAFLTILIVSSTVVFLRRLLPVLDIIRNAKSEPGFHLDPILPRIQQFVWEVLCQGKVIQERPLPGVAHAFVFWGFCAFALVTVNHIAQGFRINLIPPHSWLGLIYFSFVGLFAVAVAVSITGLAIRRFVVQPRWLGTVKPESGVIALLILTLMLTYLAGFGVEVGTLAGKAVWWTHTLALLIFLPLIPHTKHMHLVLSPAAVFAKRPGFSDIPKLEGDEDFGLNTGRDITNVMALQAFSCVECGRCTEHCPAYNTEKVLNPKEVILGLRDYLKAEGLASEKPLSDGFVSDEAIFQCTTCGSCEFQCPVGIQHLPAIIGMRRGAVNTGKWEDDYGTKLFLNLERNGNSLGFSSGERQKFIEKNQFPIYDGTQEYCLWLGCMGSYDPAGRDIIVALVKVLNHLGITYGVLRKERCNGDPARRLGNDLLFSQLAEQGIQQLEEAGAMTGASPQEGSAKNGGSRKAGFKMLSICPHCVRTMGTDWKTEFGANIQIEHHSELLARHTARLPHPDALSGKVVYHDPCYLGRYRGVYEEPRAIIASTGAQVVEAARNHERSFCCGAGGGQMFLGEEKGQRVNLTRARELVATGAETVGAACPFCQSMFRDALKEVSDAPPQLLDIVQIAAARLP